MKDAAQDPVKDNLARSFFSYAEYAKKMLAQSVPDLGSPKLKLKIAHIAPQVLLKTRVDSLERSNQFETLLSDWGKFVSTKFPSIGSAAVDEIFGRIRTRLPEFFRRSRFYVEVFNGKNVNSQDYFDLLLTQTQQRQVKITRLWMCGARFPQQQVDFGSFQIRKYTRKELDALVRNDVNQIFYPDAVINSNILSKYWFVKEESLVLREGLPELQRILEERTGTSLNWSDPPSSEPLELEFPPKYLQLLALGDWKGSDASPQEFFSTPLEIQVDDDILAEPSPVPYEAKAIKDRLDDPGFWVSLTQSQVAELRSRVEMAQKVLNDVDLEKYNWQFINIALGYLAKAFLTKYELDQLLWNVVVLESLFGEEDKGVIATLRSRLARVFGATEAQKKAVRRRFDELYDFRSMLAHGKVYSRKAVVGHLADARYLAKESVLWFLKYIAHVHLALSGQKVSPEKFPRRHELLANLDLDDESSERLRALLNMNLRFPG